MKFRITRRSTNIWKYVHVPFKKTAPDDDIQVQQNVDAVVTFGGSCGSFSSVLVRLVDIKSAAPQDALFI